MIRKICGSSSLFHIFTNFTISQLKQNNSDDDIKMLFSQEEFEMVYVTLSIVWKLPKTDLHCILNEVIKSMKDKSLILTMIKNVTIFIGQFCRIIGLFK